MRVVKYIIKLIDEFVVTRYLSRLLPLINSRTFSFEDLINSYKGEPMLGDLMIWAISTIFMSMTLLLMVGHPALIEDSVSSPTLSTHLALFISLSTTALFIYGHIFLNHIFPGKNQRERTIREEIQSLINERQSSHFAEKKLQVKLVSELNNPKEFCLKYFNKKASGFIDFYTKRVFNLDKTVDFDFLYYSLLIPKRKLLSVDALRKILLVRKKVLPLNLMNAMNKVEILFEDYSLSNIENIFTMGKGDDYFKELLSQGEYHALPLYRSFAEAEELRAVKRKLFHTSLLQLNFVSHHKWRFKVLQTREAYLQASSDFSNCVKVYFENESDIVLVFEDNLPYACIEIKDKKITEMSSHRNFPILDETPLREFLKFYLK